MLKKKIIISAICSVCTAAILAMSGCSKTGSPTPDPQPTPTEAATEVEVEAKAESNEPYVSPYGLENLTDINFSQMDMPAEGEEYAVITTSFGVIELRLFPQYAPKAVENFVTLAKRGYYKDMLFHRVIEDFMVQTGDPEGTGMGGESIWPDEGFYLEVNPVLRHYRGALGMARSNDPNSHGSQFYIVQNREIQQAYIDEMEMMKGLQDSPIDEGAVETVGDLFSTEVIDNYFKLNGAPMLDFSYTVFGQVISGMDVVDKIAAVETDEDDRPIEDVILESVEIKKYGE